MCIRDRYMGIGIKSEDLDKVCKAFGKIEDESFKTLNPQGAGLGLVIANSLIQMIGGKSGLLIESKYGEGSRFSFTLRQERQSSTNGSGEGGNRHDTSGDDRGNHQDDWLVNEMYSNDSLLSNRLFLLASRRETKPSALTTPRCTPRELNISAIGGHLALDSGRMRLLSNHKCIDVLIVDDNDFNIESLKRVLSKFKITFESCYNGLECLKRVQEKHQERNGCQSCTKPYRLILMDCEMPVMDGFEATKSLKQLMAQRLLPDVPIVGCTALSGEGESQKCSQVGMDGFLTKPVSHGKLLALLSKYKLQKKIFLQIEIQLMSAFVYISFNCATLWRTFQCLRPQS
eukprot:TRINITY_DN2490_c0_g1_i2.p1 TRINITY_DN2490_c0_g1~~TRINITY_DN2490_c0_g1_i2.p1  ORF type:complete len:344 (-),score=65.50 TRINITY_DN2490_c0_g1_i2:147-1178(-)